MQDPFARRLEQMAQSGWDGFDDAAMQNMVSDARVAAEAERQERRRVARLYAEAFETPAGRQVLALLRLQTIDRPPTQVELDERDPLAFALGQARRQGAANVIHMIESALAEARGEEPLDG